MFTLPKIALVGRPNVGKSTLFNRLLGRRQAVVAPIAGTTRDRLEEDLTWEGKGFTLVDMAGLEPALYEKTEINQATQNQVKKALEDASLLVWVVDGSVGVTKADGIIASLLRNLNKPLLVAVNKLDHPKHEPNLYEFAQFGFEPVLGISALHDLGIIELLKQITNHLPETPAEDPEEKERELKVSIAGRPNVGKSTLLNALLGETRSVVSQVPGTTRDTVDSTLPAEKLFPGTFTKWRNVRLIDTAGIRRRGKIGHEIEAWSVVRTLDALDEAEVVLFMIDATQGLVHQDLQVSQKIVTAGKAMVLLINKWDAVLAAKNLFPGTEEEQALQEQFLNTLRHQAPFLRWVQVIFLSAKENMNLNVLGKLVLKAFQAWDTRVTEEELQTLTEHLQKNPRFNNLQKIIYLHGKPPVFHLHVEGKKLPHFSSIRLAENAIRDYFMIGSSPIKIWVVPSVKARNY